MKILVVCTGNTCRSPMTEGVLKKIIREHKINNIEVISAGISANNHSSAHPNAIKACKDIGIDISSHVSKNINTIDLDKIDKFIVMTKSQKQYLINLNIFPEKIYILGNGIIDPFNQGDIIYEKCLEEILKNLTFKKFLLSILK